MISKVLTLGVVFCASATAFTAFADRSDRDSLRPPAYLEANNIMPQSFKLSWESGDERTAGFYVGAKVGRRAPECSETQQLGNYYTKSYINLAPNTTYSITVCAYDAEGRMSRPASIRVTTALPGEGEESEVTLPRPRGLSVSDVTQSSYRVNWQIGRGVTGYYIGAALGNRALRCDELSNLGLFDTYVYTSQAPNNLYTITVCSYDAEGNVSEPAVVRVRTAG